MTNTEKMNFIKQVATTIFQSKMVNSDITKISIIHPNIINDPNKGKGAYGRWFVNGTLRGFDIDLNLGNKVAKLRFIEHNPNKVDAQGNLKPLSNLARQGHQIVWMINRAITNGFLGRVQDGEWISAKDYAYTKAGSGQNASQDRTMNGVPVIPQETNIPEYVVQNTEILDEEVEIPYEYR